MCKNKLIVLFVIILVSFNPFAFAISTGSCFDTDSKVMLHMDGTNGSTTFTDSSTSAHTMSREGSTQPTISTAQSKFGGASGNWTGGFNGSGGVFTSIAAGDQIGTGTFTFDAWIYFSSIAGQPGIFGYGSGISNANSFTISYDSGTSNLYCYFGGVAKTFSWSPSATTWYHIAVVRDGSNNLYAFVNGTQIGSTLSTTANLTGNSGKITLGEEAGGFSLLNYWQGYIDEARLVVGTSVWTANFTSPSSAYPVCSNGHNLTLTGVGQ